MGLNISQSVFDKYYELIDSTFDIFGVTCQLVSINKIEEISHNPNNNIPNKNSINAHRTGGGGAYDVGNKTFKEVETITDIKLKVYWDNKQWISITDNIKLPEGSIQTIGLMSDLPKVLKAKQLIAHKDIKDIKEMRFERVGEFVPIGIKQQRYFACFWKRA